MKKIIIAILVVSLVINPVGVYASSAAATLEISGSLASGGLSGGADSKMIALAFTSMVIYGMGMSVKLNEQAKAAGETVQSYLDNMYAKWVGGTSATELTEEQREELKKRFKVIATGGSDSNGNSNNKISRNGKIFLASGALYLIRKFLNFLKNQNQIHPDAEIVPGPTVNNTYYGNTIYVRLGSSAGVNNIAEVQCVDSNYSNVLINIAWVKCYFSSQNTTTRYFVGYYPKTQGDFYIRSRTGRLINGVFTSSQSYSYSQAYGKNNTAGQFNYGLASWGDSPVSFTDGVIDISEQGYYFGTLGNYLAGLNGWEVEIPGVDNYVSGDYDESTLDNPNDAYTVIDPAIYQQLLQNLEAGTQAQLNTADYVKAIMYQLNKLSNPEAAPVPESVPVVNPTDLSPNPQPLPDPAQDPVPAIFPPEEPAPGDNDPPPDSDPVTDPDPAPPDVAVPHMMIPLDEYFPFCIPFDVYHLLQKLSADPVAPSYTIGFTVYGTEVNYTISLDAFSNAMVIVRRMELFVCIIGLAIASRKIFTR